MITKEQRRQMEYMLDMLADTVNTSEEEIKKQWKESKTQILKNQVKCLRHLVIDLTD